MNTSALVIQVALLFLPGLIWERIHATYVLKDKAEQFEVIRRALVFSVVSYLVTFAFYAAAHRRFILVSLQGDHIDLNIKIVREIGYATLVAFVLLLAHIWFDSRRIFSVFVRATKLTQRYGPEDVWDYTFSGKDPLFGFIHLRDFEKEIIYAGKVELYSESEKLRELVLSEVVVYRFDGSELFDAPRVYISRDKDNIDIEFPKPPAGKLDVKGSAKSEGAQLDFDFRRGGSHDHG